MIETFMKNSNYPIKSLNDETSIGDSTWAELKDMAMESSEK